MSQDVVEFGETAPRQPRKTLNIPKLKVPIAGPLAIAAIIAAVWSVIGKWMSATYNLGEANRAPQSSAGQIQLTATNNLFGFVYVFSLLAMAICLTIALRGDAVVRSTARLAGLATAGFSAAIIMVNAYSFSDDPTRQELYYGTNEAATITTHFHGGLYAAMVCVLLCIAALTLNNWRPAAQTEEHEPSELIEYEDEAEDLIVITEPASPVTPSHELYMRK